MGVVLFAALSFALFASPALAQQHFIKDYTNADGLPQAQCLSILQDHDGYLWFGTYGGVARYNGVEFEVFTSRDGLVGNVVTAIAQGRGDRMFFGTLDGLTVLDEGRFTEVRGPGSESITGIRFIFTDPQRGRWIATRWGLYRHRGQEVVRYDEADGLPSATIMTVGSDLEGNVWIGTDAGLARAEGDRFVPVDDGLPAGTSVRAIIANQKGLWIGTEAGVFLYDGTRFELVDAPVFASQATRSIRSAALDPQGDVWFGTNGGAVHTHSSGFQLISEANGLANDSIAALVADREGNIWFGTDNGVSKLVPGPFMGYTRADGLPHDFVRDIARDADGRTWLATRDGVGIIEPDGEIWTIDADDGLTQPRVYAVTPLADGSTLIGTTGGLFRWHPGGMRHYTVADGLPAEFIRALEPDGSGGVWIGTDRGLARWTGSGVDPLADSPELSTLDVVSLETDSEGRLWIGTMGAGLFRYNRQYLELVGPTDELKLTLWSLAADGEGGMWVGTNGAGAFYLHEQGNLRLSTLDGLSNDFVWQVHPDRSGRVWFYTNRGLDRWNGTRFVHFGLADGLLNLEGGADSVFEDLDGNIWFGNGSGLIRYVPHHESSDTEAPLVHIAMATAGDEAIDIESGEPIVLPKSRDTISLAFDGLSFHDEERVRYRYRLVGASQEWSPLTTQRQVSYLRLPAGDYTFEVESYSAHGFVSEDPARLSFTIEPAWTETWIFKAGIALLLVGTVLTIYWWRHHHVEREKQRLEQAVEARSHELAKSEERIRTALLNTPTFVFNQDSSLRYTWVHNELLGLEPEQVLNAHDADLLDPHSAEVLTRIKQLVLDTCEGTRQEITIERAGHRYCLDLTVEPLREGKRVVGITGAAWDITEKKSLEDLLLQSQKMEAVGRLAGGVAHDFNNLLTGITGFAQLGLGRLPDDSRVAKDMRQILNCSARAAVLTQQLLAFSRRQPLEKSVVDLSDLVAELMKLLRRVIGEDIELRFSAAPDLGNVRVDHGQIEQVLMNIAVNARDAMLEGGVLSIALDNATISDDELGRYRGAKSGAYVRMTVSDTGCGMDRDTQEHIFEPFFTTKEVGKGTGLGLSTVYGIVKQHDGYVDVDSRAGRGSTFEIFLPRVAGGVEHTESVLQTDTPDGTETILLVEDEEAVRCVAREWLENLGYQVYAAENAQEAEQIFAFQGGGIDLLLTDVVMPGKSGLELYRQLARSDSALKVLYMSGYTGDDLNGGEAFAASGCLWKPFSLELLAEKVRSTLDAVAQVAAPSRQ